MAETTTPATARLYHICDALQASDDPGCCGLLPRTRRNTKAHLQPWQLLVLILAGWISRQQQDAIECLPTENQVLGEKLGKKRVLLNDDQRRWLTVKG